MLRCGIKRLFFLLFTFLVVAPLTLMVWRGIWGLLDEYITTINDEVNITSSTYHPSTGCHFNKTPSFDNNLQNIHPGSLSNIFQYCYNIFIIRLLENSNIRKCFEYIYSSFKKSSIQRLYSVYGRVNTTFCL